MFNPETESYGDYLWRSARANPYRALAGMILAERPEKDDGTEGARAFLDSEDYGRAMVCDNLAAMICGTFEIANWPKPSAEVFLAATQHEREAA